MLRSKSIALAIALLLPAIANAKTWYVSASPVGGADCSSWAQACSLVTAKGKVISNLDEIWIKAGIYKFNAELVNPSYTSPSAVTYALRIYGGFGGTETALDFRNSTKNAVVFSGDSDGDDSGPVSGGVTPSYANVVTESIQSRFIRFSGTGVNTASPVNILDGITITGMDLGANIGGIKIENAKVEMNNVKFIGNKGNAAAIYLTGAFSSATLTNMVFTKNGSATDTGGAIFADSTSFLSCDICTFTSNANSNNASSMGGAIRATSGTSTTISHSAFELNTSAMHGGAVSISGPARLSVSSTLFNNNTATAHGGGLWVESSVNGNVSSTTFYDNKAGQFGGAIGNFNSTIVLNYSTIYNNKTTSTPNPGNGLGAGLAIGIGNSSVYDLKANILMGNYNTQTNDTQNIWRLKSTALDSDNPKIIDSGYNLIGFGLTGLGAGAGMWEGLTGNVPNIPTAITFATVFPNAAANKTINPEAITTADKIIETTLKDNGGYAKSLKLALGSIAIDAIPNDLPVGGVGTSPTDPFTSIAQARAVMASYSSYDAGKYFFKIGGVAFATYVDKEGYVLVASSNSANMQAAPYTQVTTLNQRSDSLLNSSIMAKFTASEIDEVRLSSYGQGTRGTFDGFSKDPDVITSLAAFQSLNNPGDGGTWFVTQSSLGVNYFTGSATGRLSLASEIYHANGQAGIHWIPTRPNEALLYPGNPDSSTAPTFNDELDLWVRSSKGNCNGTVLEDQRGLPRADYVNPNDPNQYGDIHACDMGGFEWNNGYQLDCWNEDGLRPENSLSGGTASLCFSDLNSISPKSLIDNFGYINWQSLIILSLLGVFRYRNKGIHKK